MFRKSFVQALIKFALKSVTFVGWVIAYFYLEEVRWLQDDLAYMPTYQCPLPQSLESKKKKHDGLLQAEADLRVADETGIDTNASGIAVEATGTEERPGMKEILASPVVRSVLTSYACLAFVAVCHDAIWALW
jgi:hypothetical protein